MLDEEAYAFLRTLSVREQRRLEVVFNAMRDHPFSEPSFVEFDSDGQEVFHRFLDRYSIMYHIDHAARLVLIQHITQNS